MTANELDKLKIDLSVKAKNGIDFTLSASIIWFIIAYIWTLKFNSYDKSIFVFIVGAPLFPLAFILSKLFKTNWKIPENPLQPLGLWLNFAQLIYFPFLIFTMIKMPDYFIMTYAIITGAHLFSYSWFYNTIWYAMFGGLIALAVLLVALKLPNNKMYIIAIITGSLLLLLTILLYFDALKKSKTNES
ncbi:MAG: hypothetical protein M3Z26_18145 [Bacteroidota bacterium]|nr:hypothetical protein [Bacteroidota bacterium]